MAHLRCENDRQKAYIEPMNKTSKSPVQKPVVLCILDGWGERAESLNNAIKTGHTPNWNRMVETGLKSQLIASGLNVGLPDGQMGNSEVGHMTIGSGRVILQDLEKAGLVKQAEKRKGRIVTPQGQKLLDGVAKNIS